MKNLFEVTLLSADELQRSRIGWTSNYSINKTDFASILGARDKGNDYGDYWCKQDWINNFNPDTKIDFVCIWGSFNKTQANDEKVCIDPMIKYSSIKPYAKTTGWSNNTFYVSFGEYPQECVEEDTARLLSELYYNNKLKQTGKRYTTQILYPNDLFKEICGDRFIPFEHIEYEYDGDRYVRVESRNKVKLSIKYHNYNYNSYWFKVSPIEWEVDEANDIAVATSSLLSGIRYFYQSFEGEKTNTETSCTFEDTPLYKYLNRYFAKEILPLNIIYDKNFKDNNEYSNNMYNNLIQSKFK